MTDVSPLELNRRRYLPKLPASLRAGLGKLEAVRGLPTSPQGDAAEIQKAFPRTCGLQVVEFRSGEHSAEKHPFNVGAVLSGGQAPGGHNVIAGLYDAIHSLHPNSRLLGFAGGPAGLLEGNTLELDTATIDRYRNTGGFDIIGSGRTKLETPEHFAASRRVAEKLRLDCLVVIGGDDSNTNAANLAEYLLEQGSAVRVIGVPKTIDGDLKNHHIPVSFGFDTAVKIYSGLVGNICRDALSSKKYWHFIKLMGRSASHIALEVALQTQPNITLISEEVAHRGLGLEEIVESIASIVADRADKGRNFGIVLVPEGLVEFIPSVKKLIRALNDLLVGKAGKFDALENIAAKLEYVRSALDPASAGVLDSLPPRIREQLLWDRDPHGNVQVSRIETEALLSEMVDVKLKSWKLENRYKGKFSSQRHFFGYEGRCAPPSNFDADYAYSLGYAAAALGFMEYTGYMASVTGLHRPAAEWSAGGIPISMLLNMEKRRGTQKPVIRKALVDLEGPVFREFASRRQNWQASEEYLFPGPIQYFGPVEICDSITKTLELEQKSIMTPSDSA